MVASVYYILNIKTKLWRFSRIIVGTSLPISFGRIPAYFFPKLRFQLQGFEIWVKFILAAERANYKIEKKPQKTTLYNPVHAVHT